MKCPYRPIITASDTAFKKVTTTEFAECYYDECPWYSPKYAMSNGMSVDEFCQKCQTEHTQANNERERYRR